MAAAHRAGRAEQRLTALAVVERRPGDADRLGGARVLRLRVVDRRHVDPRARARDQPPASLHLVEEARGDARASMRGAPDVRGEQQVGAGPGDRDVREPALLGDAVVGHRPAEALSSGEVVPVVRRRPAEPGQPLARRRAGRRAGSPGRRASPCRWGRRAPTPVADELARCPSGRGTTPSTSPARRRRPTPGPWPRGPSSPGRRRCRASTQPRSSPRSSLDGGLEPREEAAERGPVGARGEGRPRRRRRRRGGRAPHRGASPGRASTSMSRPSARSASATSSASASPVSERSRRTARPARRAARSATGAESSGPRRRPSVTGGRSSSASTMLARSLASGGEVGAPAPRPGALAGPRPRAQPVEVGRARAGRTAR